MKSKFSSVLLASVLLLPTLIQPITAQEVGQDKITDEQLEGPAFGVNVVSLSDAKEIFKNAEVRLPTKSGALIFDVAAYGPAQSAGLSKLDIITRVDKTNVGSAEEFKAAVASLDVNKDYELLGYRVKELPNGKLSWKRGTVNLKPVKRRDMYLSAMNTQVDNVRNVTAYKHKDSSEFLNVESDVFCYILAAPNAKPTLRLKIQYVATEWLFIKAFSVKVGDRTFEIDASGFGKMERDNGGGKIWEWYDQPVDQRTLEMLRAVATAKEAIIRFEGDQYQKDFEVNEKLRDRIRTVLVVHQILENEASKKNGPE